MLFYITSHFSWNFIFFIKNFKVKTHLTYSERKNINMQFSKNGTHVFIHFCGKLITLVSNFIVIKISEKTYLKDDTTLYCGDKNIQKVFSDIIFKDPLKPFKVDFKI